LHVCDKQIKCPTSIRRHLKSENKNKGQAKCATSIRKHLKSKNRKEASQAKTTSSSLPL
jgi:predicted nucleotidyltransferase